MTIAGPSGVSAGGGVLAVYGNQEKTKGRELWVLVRV
jgi:hypothetical protein